MNSRPLRTETLDTPLGWMALVESPVGACYLTIGHSSEAAALHTVAERLGEVPHWSNDRGEVGRLLLDYSSGKEVSLDEIPLDIPASTDFVDRVRQRCREIPYGETLSYGELATAAGAPRAARAIGNVMAANPTPLLVPCHRVVAAGGRLGGFSAPDGVDFKQRLLEMETSVVDGKELVGSSR